MAPDYQLAEDMCEMKVEEVLLEDGQVSWNLKRLRAEHDLVAVAEDDAEGSEGISVESPADRGSKSLIDGKLIDSERVGVAIRLHGFEGDRRRHAVANLSSRYRRVRIPLNGDRVDQPREHVSHRSGTRTGGQHRDQR